MRGERSMIIDYDIFYYLYYVRVYPGPRHTPVVVKKSRSILLKIINTQVRRFLATIKQVTTLPSESDNGNK